MNHQALLFCADEKTVRAVSQVFRELDFTVEVNNEPFDAVKRLMAQHFDAIVVDCESEQNATLLFKSARNSALNNGSLAVAVVEGQANIAKAFRLGGNLVLTKPINLEQAKGTLRVARGMLRKAEANKLAASISNPSHPAVSEVAEPKALAAAGQKAVLTPLPVQATSTIAPSLGVDKAETKTASAEAAVAESKTDAPKATAAEKKPGGGLSFGSATAAAPAKETPAIKTAEKLEPTPAAAGAAKAAVEKAAAPASKPATGTAKSAASPRFATLGVKQQDETDEAQGHKNFWIAAVIVLALAAGAYFGWTKYHDIIKLPFTQTNAETVAPPAINVPKPPAPVAAVPAAPAEAPAVTPGQPVAATVDPVAATTPSAVGIVRLSETTSQGLLVKRLDPSYPDQAKEQKLEGAVHLQARINRAGEVTQVTTISGNAILAQAATAAVKQWKYKPYLVNGAPVEVLTPITVDLKP